MGVGMTREYSDARPVDDVAALEAVRLVADEYGIPTGDLKTCIAYLLDGNLTGDRHKCAFTIAIELRRLGWEPAAVEAALARWAKKIGYRVRDAQRAVKNAFLKKPDGQFKYYPPGLRKSGVYKQVLEPVCSEVGCPANCPAFAGKYQGFPRETFARFEELGWPSHLKNIRQFRAIDTYRAICQREQQLQLAPGVELLTTYKQLAEIGGLHYTTVGNTLRKLDQLGLIHFEPGSGDGPHAKNRVPSRIRRVIPIPRLPSSEESRAAITTDRQSRPEIGRARQAGDAA
jgi:hypothetical protein